MVAVIAPEKDIYGELEILKNLFQAGLKYYHLRKPYKSYEEHVEYLNKIPKKYHPCIITHYHHPLVKEFSLKGIHLKEQVRNTVSNVKNYIAALNPSFVSTSFHELEELLNCSYNYDYHLLSPVFSSISKKGYLGKEICVASIPKKIIGLGGITEENLPQCIALGYAGVAVLGSIWYRPNPIEIFTQMQQYFYPIH